MPDPDTVAIPVLAGAALAQGITFLYGQATEVLRIRREDKVAHRTALVVPDVFEPLGRAVQPDLAVLAARAHDLQMLLHIAAPFANRPPAELDGTDETLRACFGHIREALEHIYGTRFTFAGERSSDQRVRQEVKHIDAPTTGIKIRGSDGSKIPGGDVTQNVETVHRNGELTGIEIDLRG